MGYATSSAKIVLYITYLMFVALPALGLTLEESRASSLESHLTENGFEDVSVILEDSYAIVAYENRTYRHGVTALREAMAILLPMAEEGVGITLIPQNRKIPLVAVTMPADELTEEFPNERFVPAIDASLDVDSVWRKTQAVQNTNFFSRKLDIIVHPQFKARFGDYDNWVKSQINLAPEINITLWKGMSLSAQLIIPLQNELGEEGNHLRPGRLTVNQAFRLLHSTFVSATMGYFTQNRYGTDLDIRKYFADGKWSIGANMGYTGYASYLRGTWYYSNMDTLTAFLNVEHRFPRYDLSLSATYGRFLYQDRGWRFDILRQFGEVSIGFFAIKTEEGTNGGFDFSMPIFPPKYLKVGSIRVRPGKELSWEYRYKGLPKNGIQYSTGDSIIDEFAKGFNPDYIENQIADSED